MKKKILIFLIPLLVLVLLLGGAGLYAYLTVKSFEPSINALQQTGAELSASFQGQDLATAKIKVKTLESQVADLNNQYQKVGWTKAIPFLGAYTQDGQSAINAGIALVRSVDTLIVS